MNMHKVDGAEMLGILIRKLTENWEKLCDEYLDEDEARPDFKVLPTTNYIMWSSKNVVNNIKLVGGDDEIATHGSLSFACNQVDGLTLKGYPILDDIVIKCIDDDDNSCEAEYNKLYTILGENLATMIVDIRTPELLLDYLYLYQKICIGRYLYEIRNIITDDAVTGSDMLSKLNNFAMSTLGESRKIDKNDPLTRYEVVTYDREAIKYVGIDLNYIRSTFNAYNQAIERSRIFYVPDEIYNS